MNSKRELTEKQKTFLDVLYTEAEGDLKKAADIAGYSSYHYAMKSLSDEIIEKTKYFLALNAPKAAMKITGVLDDPAAIGNKELMRAAEQILDRVGIHKTERVELDTNAGALFILPPKNVSESQTKESDDPVRL